MAAPGHRNRRRSAALTCGGLLLVVGVAVGGLIFASVDRPVQPQRQPDGTTFSLLGVTTPNQPGLVTGPPLFRLLAPLLSDEQERPLGVRRLQHKYGPLNLWIKNTGVATNPPPAQPLAPFEFQPPIEAADDLGNLASLPNNMQLWSYELESRPVYRAVIVGTLPRRGRELTLRIYDEHARSKSETVARFRVRNPLVGQFPEWNARPLPARQPMGDVEAHLLSLRSGIRDPSQAKGFGALDRGIWTRAAFAVRKDGRISVDWTPNGITVQDATGNQWASKVLPDSKSAAGELAVFFGGNLWDEPAWKLTTTFARVDGFAAGDLCGVGATLPRHGITDAVSKAVNLRDMTLRVASVVAKDSSYDVKFGSSIDGPQVIMDLEGGRLDKQLRLVGVSAAGFEWKGAVGSGMFLPRRRCFRLPDETPPGPVRLRFALDDSRTVTFIARPDPPSAARAQ